MTESRLTYLFKVYFEKSATPAERDELMQLLALSENDEQLDTLLLQTWQQFKTEKQVFSESSNEEMLANILAKTNTHTPVSMAVKNRSRSPRIAMAAAVLLLTIAGIYFVVNSGPVPMQIVKAQKRDQPAGDSIVPGGSKALLTLSNGSKIVLDSNRVGNLATQGNARITNSQTSVLTYNASNDNGGHVVYNTLSTANGGQYQLVLSDGTRIWLNAFSSIRFPTNFTGNERNVSVTGEAYFEVASNAGMPFTINVQDMQVRVLGTRFNVMAYEDENSVNTTLTEGSVKIYRGALNKTLVPGQQARVNKSGDIKVVEADIEEVTAWKNGWFQFNAYDIKKLMRQVSRWYNVEVVYNGKIPPGHFTGMVSRQNNISQVLKILEAGDVKFGIEGKKVTVY